MEIESRLLPCGLHIVGVPPTAEEAVATLVNIAEIDRPDQKPEPIKGLPGILAKAIGREIESVYQGSNKVGVRDVVAADFVTHKDFVVLSRRSQSAGAAISPRSIARGDIA